MQNLDIECAKTGRELAELDKDDRVLTRALGVLEEQGLYACFLFLHTQNAGREASSKSVGCKVSCKLAGFLRQVPLDPPLLRDGDVFTALQALSEDLDQLLFARDLLRQTLIYGRYHAKGANAQ